MAPYGTGQAIIFFALWFLLSFFFFLPNVIRHRLDVCHAFIHGASVRIYDAGLKVGWLQFNVLFQHKYGYIRDDANLKCAAHRLIENTG